MRYSLVLTCKKGEGHNGTADDSAAGTHPVHVIVIVRLARLLKGVRAVVAGEVAERGNDHLAERRVDIEEEGAVDVPVPHLAEVGLVPTHPVGLHHLSVGKVDKGI